MIGYLSALDLFVFPSRDELYSLVVLDAQALGLPVIGAAAGGTLDQIEEGKSGFLYPVGDPDALARRIGRYLEQPALREEHGRAGRLFVERHHDMKKTIDELLRWYGAERTAA